jgi:hypothetical protein
MFGEGNSQGSANPKYGARSLITALLSRSLIHMSLKAADEVRQRFGRCSKRLSLSSNLLSARLQEAEILLAVYLPSDDNATRMIDRRLEGWAFHR